MNQLIKFEPARLPTKTETIQAIDAAETYNQVKDIYDIWEAARAYAASKRDEYAEADAAEVKAKAEFRMADMIKVAEANGQLLVHGGFAQSKDSPRESITTRATLGLKGKRLDRINKLGKIPLAERGDYISNLRDRIINRDRNRLMALAKKDHEDIWRRFSNHGLVMVTAINHFLLDDDLARDVRNITKAIPKLTEEDLEIVNQIATALRSLSARAGDAASLLPTFKEVKS